MPGDDSNSEVRTHPDLRWDVVIMSYRVRSPDFWSRNGFPSLCHRHHAERHKETATRTARNFKGVGR